jgi:hypothetical protein
VQIEIEPALLPLPIPDFRCACSTARVHGSSHYVNLARRIMRIYEWIETDQKQHSTTFD